jgi:hypothetical protein
VDLPSLNVLEPSPGHRLPGADWEVALREADGNACAYGHLADGACSLLFPDVASFVFRTATNEAVATPEPGAGRELILDTYYAAALPLALQASGFEALHGSAVGSSSGVTAFCALSGIGKSTVAYAMSRRGYPLWADDAVIFEAGTDLPVVSHRIPFKLNLRQQSKQFFGIRSEAGCEQPSHARHETEPLRAVIVLERIAAGSRVPRVDVQRLGLRKALQAVLPHAHRFSLNDSDRRRATLESYLRLVGQVPIFLASFSPGFVHLRALLDEIERAVEEA